MNLQKIKKITCVILCFLSIVSSTKLKLYSDVLPKFNLESYINSSPRFFDYGSIEIKEKSILEDKNIKINYIHIDEKEVYCNVKIGLRIRSDSSIDSPQIGSIKYTEGIIVDGITPDKEWYHCKKDSLEGYIYKEYLSDEKLNISKFSDTVIEDSNDIDVYVIENKENLQYLGRFQLTFYCSCTICTGGSNITATGTIPVEGRTIAVDPNLIPLGSIVIINGNTYVAEDRGGAINGKKIDVYMNSHQDARSAGIQYADVYIQR